MSVQNLKLRIIPKFPASVSVGSGLTLTNTAGAYSITLANNLTQVAALTLGPNQAIYWPSLGVAGSYSLTSTGRSIAGTTGATADKSVLTSTAGGAVSFSTTPTVAGLTVNANAGTIPAPAAGAVAQIAGADGANTFATYDAFGSAGFSTGVQFRKARNTAAAPSAIQADDPIGGVYAYGYMATGYCTTQRGFSGFFAGENWDDTHNATYWAVYTTPTAGVASVERLRVNPDGSMRVGTQTAPSTPAANKLAVYADSTSKTLNARNDAGAVTMTVAALGAGATNVVVNSMANGVLGTTTVSTPSALCFSTGGGATLAAGTTYYIGNSIFGTTSNQDGVVMRLPFACTISNLFVAAVAAPGAAKNFTYTIQKNGVDTAVTATINGAASTNANDTTHSVSFAQGDTIALKAVIDAAAAATFHTATLRLAFS